MRFPAFVFGRAYGCASLVVLVLDVYCIVKIVESTAKTSTKVLWILLVIFFPLLGAILWLLLGRSS
jgi:hypothetical protein